MSLKVDTSTRDKEKRLSYIIYLLVAVIFFYLVLNYLKCPGTAEIRYVCSDGNIVGQATDCVLPEPEGKGCIVLNESCNESIVYLINSTQVVYVCMNGSVVGKSSDCFTDVNESTTTTIKTISTTTTTIKSTKECVQLGCPHGTNIVGSKSRGEFFGCGCYVAKYMIEKDDILCFESIKAAQNYVYEGNKTLSECNICPLVK